MTNASAPRRPEPPAGPVTPYVGLVPYGEEDAGFFFGRDEERRIVAGNLRAYRLTLLYGPSGVGKTSLLRAGVIHDLREQMREIAASKLEPPTFAVCAFAAWRDDPLVALMEAVRVAAAEALGSDELRPWSPGESVVETLRSWTEHVRTLLLVLDQFEDYFLYHPDEDGEGTFRGELPAIVNEPNLRVNVLLSIREDSLAKLDRFKGRIPRLFANYVRVQHLSRGAARTAIEGPVRAWNRRLAPRELSYTLEPALVEAVIDAAATGGLALGREGADRETTASDSDRVEAPFLQLVMDRLWRATAAASSRHLTLSRLEQLGGAQQIVEKHLLEALGALALREQTVAADLFRFLVTRSQTKVANSASDLAEWTGRSEGEVTAVLDKLCQGESGRILRRVPPHPTGSSAMRYELFHDVLAEPILEWRREFEQERRRRAAIRRLVRVGGVLTSLVAVFAALGIWALLQRNEARSATRSATSLALASAARTQLEDHLDRSLLLGLEAYRASPSAEAASAMIEALEAARRSGAEAILRGGSDGVRAIAFSPDGRTLASADFDGAIRLWDTRARTTLGVPLLGHEGEVWGVTFSPDGLTLVSSGFDGTIRLWDVEDRSPIGEPVDAGLGAVRAVAFSPDGRTLAFAGSDETVRLWDVRARRELNRPLRGHQGEVVSVVFSPDGRMLASAGYDRTVRLWDVRTRAPLGGPLRGHTGEVWTVAFSPDGRIVASAGYDGTVRLWDARTRKPLGRPLNGNGGQVWSVAFSPDGRTLASSAFDRTVRLWEIRSGTAIRSLRGHTRGVISVAFRHDGILASSSFDGTVRLWDTRRSRFGEPLRGHTDRIKTVSFSPREQMLASAGFDRTIRLWDVQAQALLAELGDGRSDSIESVAFSPNGGILASSSVDGSIELSRVPGGRSIGELHGHEGAVQSVAFSHDGRALASGGFDGTVRLWDVQSRRPLGKPLLGHEGPVWSVALSADGRTLASAGSDGTLRLWDLKSRIERRSIRQPDVFLSVAFSPNGDTVAGGSVGGSVQLWDARAGEPLGEPLRGHTGRVESVAFSPDGRTLASAGDDGTVRLWDVPGRQSRGQPLRGHSGAVFSVAFGPDGRTLASGGDDRTVRLWEGILWRDFADLRAQVCGLVVRSLTRLEWLELAPGLEYRRTCPP